jgi:hypothetical protein
MLSAIDGNRVMESPARVAIRPRSNRLLVALAAVWIMLSLAVGGALQRDAAEAGQQQAVTRTAQP